MVLTGERMILGRMDKKVEFEHLCRYRLARLLTKNKIVLDAACGSGYGSWELSAAAQKVTGIDISEETIEYAKEKYVADNLEYIVGSVAKLPFENEQFDVVISFETIEHVDETTQNLFLKEIGRVLKKDGLLIMSTPNKKVFTDRRSGHSSKYHVKEFYEEEFRLFLSGQFSNVCFKRQFYANMACIIDEKDKLISNIEDMTDEALYDVAICSNSEESIKEAEKNNLMVRYPQEYEEFDDYLQVFYSSTPAYDEDRMQLYQYSSNENVQRISMDMDGINARFIRIDPTKNAAKIKVIQTEICGEEKFCIEPYKNNSVQSMNGYKMFVEDPNFFFDLGREVWINKINIDFIVEKLEPGEVYGFLNRVRLEIENKENEISELQNKISNILEQNNLFEAENEKKEQYILELQGEIGKISERKELLEAENEKKEQYILELQGEIGKISERNGSLEAENEKKKKYILELQSK